MLPGDAVDALGAIGPATGANGVFFAALDLGSGTGIAGGSELGSPVGGRLGCGGCWARCGCGRDGLGWCEWGLPLGGLLLELHGVHCDDDVKGVICVEECMGMRLGEDSS